MDRMALLPLEAGGDYDLSASSYMSVIFRTPEASVSLGYTQAIRQLETSSSVSSGLFSGLRYDMRRRSRPERDKRSTMHLHSYARVSSTDKALIYNTAFAELKKVGKCPEETLY